MLERGDLVPHFVATTVDGRKLAYATIWQRRNLVLVCLAASQLSQPARAYVAELAGLWRQSGGQQSEFVITQDSVPGLPAPGVLVADRWGEIVYITSGCDVADLPSPPDLLDWVRYVESRCPECEGEAK
jgi:hypothetical protein